MLKIVLAVFLGVLIVVLEYVTSSVKSTVLNKCH